MTVCGYWLLFTQFMVYDDEGYVLWSLHNYFQVGGLYTKIYSQYGPFIYVLYDGLHRLFGIAFDNETGRGLTLGYWIGASGLAGYFTWRQTRSALCFAGASVLTFASLLIMISEPIHPGGILALLGAVGAVGGAWAIERGHHRCFALLVGVISAAMILTKINVGAFFLIAAGSWMAINLVSEKLSRTSLWLSAIGSLLVPLWLVKKLWPTPWVALFVLAFSCAALGTLLLLQTQRKPDFGWPAWLRFASGGIIAAGVILGLTWTRGTSFPMLWQGIVVAPMNQPVAYAHAADWPALMPWLATGMLLLSMFSQLRTWFWQPYLIATLRLTVMVCLLGQTLHGIDNSLTFFGFYYGLPFAWLMIVPLSEPTNSSLKLARLWVAWVFVWQTLHAYPVAGSQMGWGSFLWMPLAVGGSHEALIFWCDRVRFGRRILKPLGGIVLFATIIVILGSFGSISHARYNLGEPLGLHGASRLRLSDDIKSVYRILDKNIRQHGDMLFSYPGMFSLNIWTERPTPTTDNVTHWFSLLSEPAQQAIIDKLEADDQPVLVVQSYLINYLVYKGYPPRSNLQRYIIRNFQPVFSIDMFQFWVKKGRSIAPLSTAGLYINASHGDSILQLVTTAHGLAATVEIRGLFHPRNRVMTLMPGTGSLWRITPLHRDNSLAGKTQSTTQPISLDGITRLEISIPTGQKLPPLDILEVVIKNDSGAILDSLRFTH